MHDLSTRQRYAIAVAAALVLAFCSAHFLFNGSVANIFPWGILAVLVGLLLPLSKRQAWWLGATFGFVLSYSFLWFDKSGSLSLGQFVALVFIIILPSLFGALCAGLLSLAAYAAKHRIQRG